MNKVIVIVSDDEEQEKQQVKANEPPIRKRRRRKSALVVRADPEVQFESISPTSECTPIEKARPNLVRAVRTPTVEMVEQINRKILDRPEINEMIYKIAEERIRINNYLSAIKVPKINFMLYMGQDQLKQEIERRINVNLNIETSNEETDLK